MKIQEGKKYNVLIECHHFRSAEDIERGEFMDEIGQIHDGGFMMRCGEIYKVDYVYERDNVVFVALKTKDEFGKLIERSINLTLFLHCFEESVE
jgi:hypothetical protein